MTAKRFIIMDNLPKGTHSSIWDKQKQHNQGIGDELWLGEVVAMLNEGVILADENEQLKSEIEKLSYANEDLLSEKRNWQRMSDEYCKLLEENEQLRNRINDWHQRTFKAHEYFNILEKVIDEVCDDDISNQIWKEYEKREKLVE